MFFSWQIEETEESHRREGIAQTEIEAALSERDEIGEERDAAVQERDFVVNQNEVCVCFRD